jgi:uncharacterized protein YbjT (DUF2867 family)
MPRAPRRRPDDPRPILLTGATGFVGRALLPTLVSTGLPVRAVTRRLRPDLDRRATWIEADLQRPEDLSRAVAGARGALYLVHGMAAPTGDYAAAEEEAAARFAAAAGVAGLERIVYLGAVRPRGRPSKHLASRLAVGEVLRTGPVPVLELRASMIVGEGSASWRIVRDLALRLPAMVLPAWADSRSCPVAIEDVVAALVHGATAPLAASAVADLPGPEVLSVGEILQRVAALRGRTLPAVRAPLPAPRLSALWLRLVSDADWRVVRELVAGLEHDLLPQDGGAHWERIGRRRLVPFDEAARRALAADRPVPGLRGLLESLEEDLVQAMAPRRR